jgi:type VI secretion system secreted protein VgrG
MWLMSKRINSRVFHNKDDIEIIKAMLAEHSITPDDKTQGPYAKLEYCVQHNESDLDFVLRLMEAAGISYHFAFGDGQQTLVLCDSESAYEDTPGGSRHYYDDEAYVGRDDEHFYRWIPERRFTGNKATITDYKLQAPGDDNKGEFEGDAGFTPKLEDYRHPFLQAMGEHTESGIGRKYAEVLVQAERGTDGRFLAWGDCGSLVPGTKVSLKNHQTDEGDYLVVGCAHTIEAQPYKSGGASATPYHGEYELMKLGRFVPPLVTPKPWIGGPQTGIVVNKGGSKAINDVHTDKYGRILVHMHWNREKDSDPLGQTMWCRVAQTWAGPSKKWGAIFIPRVGMEVLVDHIDGDPDRPIVTGCVYNDKNMPPYELEADKYYTGWKTEFESKAEHHELVFIDKDGQEKVRAHSGKDLEWTVVNDESREVGNDRKTKIGTNDTLNVGDTLDITAGTKISLTVGASNIEMTGTAIKITSPNITVTATAKLSTSAGTVAEHTAGMSLTIKGGTVLIN